MKMRCLIIDDEPLAHKVIIEYAREVPFLEISGQCYLATEALPVLSRQEIDLVFLDIQMPKIKGLDFLRTLDRPPIVIITSAYQEYALESYELDVCDYLLKPFRFDRFLKAANKALKHHRQKKQPANKPVSPTEPPPEKIEQLFIKSDKRFVQVNLAEVFYLESYGNYVKVWMEDHYHLTPGTLSGFEEQLPDTAFYRIHKSYIVNTLHINYLEGNFLVMNNRKKLPLGKSYRQDFKGFIT